MPPENNQKTKVEPTDETYKLVPQHSGDTTRQWGNLPMKDAREVMKATRREMPLKWREKLERYFRRLADPQR
ncbi:hypothetical protein ACFL59_12815 [Planctomycetota bacterium]